MIDLSRVWMEKVICHLPAHIAQSDSYPSLKGFNSNATTCSRPIKTMSNPSSDQPNPTSAHNHCNGIHNINPIHSCIFSHCLLYVPSREAHMCCMTKIVPSALRSYFCMFLLIGRVAHMYCMASLVLTCAMLGDIPLQRRAICCIFVLVMGREAHMYCMARVLPPADRCWVMTCVQ